MAERVQILKGTYPIALNRWGDSQEARTLAKLGEEVWVWLFILANSRYMVSNLGRVASNLRGAEEFAKLPVPTREAYPDGGFEAAYVKYKKDCQAISERFGWIILKPTVLSSGYRSVGIYPERGKPPKTCLVHRLVAQAFDGDAPSPAHTDVRHLDGNKANNVLTNLAWGTRSENMRDVLRHRQEGRKPTPAEKEGPNWYQGYTDDDYLVRIGLEFHAEGLMTIENLTRLWRCSREVAANIINGETRLHIPRPEKSTKKQKRRSPAQKEAIMLLVREGKNAAAINEILGETLTAQAVYYYRSKIA